MTAAVAVHESLRRTLRHLVFSLHRSVAVAAKENGLSVDVARKILGRERVSLTRIGSFFEERRRLAVAAKSKKLSLLDAEVLHVVSRYSGKHKIRWWPETSISRSAFYRTCVGLEARTLVSSDGCLSDDGRSVLRALVKATRPWLSVREFFADQRNYVHGLSKTRLKSLLDLEFVSLLLDGQRSKSSLMSGLHLVGRRPAFQSRLSSLRQRGLVAWELSESGRTRVVSLLPAGEVEWDTWCRSVGWRNEFLTMPVVTSPSRLSPLRRERFAVAGGDGLVRTREQSVKRLHSVVRDGLSSTDAIGSMVFHERVSLAGRSSIYDPIDKKRMSFRLLVAVVRSGFDLKVFRLGSRRGKPRVYDRTESTLLDLVNWMPKRVVL
jgi:hypothetical protein